MWAIQRPASPVAPPSATGSTACASGAGLANPHPSLPDPLANIPKLLSQLQAPNSRTTAEKHLYVLCPNQSICINQQAAMAAGNRKNRHRTGLTCRNARTPVVPTHTKCPSDTPFKTQRRTACRSACLCRASSLPACLRPFVGPAPWLEHEGWLVCSFLAAWLVTLLCGQLHVTSIPCAKGKPISVSKPFDLV